jgi:hypothetical protein
MGAVMARKPKPKKRTTAAQPKKRKPAAQQRAELAATIRREIRQEIEANSYSGELKLKLGALDKDLALVVKKCNVLKSQLKAERDRRIDAEDSLQALQGAFDQRSRDNGLWVDIIAGSA